MGNLDFTVYSDPTLEEMHKQVAVRAASEPPRRYLGASSIGHSCERFVWYGIQGAPCEPMSAQGVYAVTDGHRTEDLIAERLRLVPGVTLETVDANGNQYGFEDGLFKGHCDGFIIGLLQAPKTPHIWEHKACNEKKFAKFESIRSKAGEKATLQQWDFTYYVQAQVYMHYFGMTRHYLTVSTPGGRQITSARTNYDKGFAEAQVAKAMRLLQAKEPPPRVSENPTWFECKWCKYKGICHET